MATTVAVVEILVAGLFAAVWVLTAAAYVADVGWDSIRSWAKEYKDWSAAVTVAGTMAIYQLGWLMNGLSRTIMWRLATRVRDYLHADRDVDHGTVRATVYQKGSAGVLEDLALDQSVIRLARVGIVNFSVISLLLFCIGGRPMVMGAIVSLVLFAGCTLQWWQRNWRYYERLIDAYQVIRRKSDSASYQTRRDKSARWWKFLTWRRPRPPSQLVESAAPVTLPR